MSTLLNLISLNKLNSSTLYHTLCFLYTYFVTKGCPLYIYSIGRTKLYFLFEEIWKKCLYSYLKLLAFCIHIYIVTKGYPLYIYSIGRKKLFFLFEKIWKKCLYSYLTLLASCIHILLLKDALSIFNLWVELNYSFTLRKSEENLFTLISHSWLLVYTYCY